MAGIQFTLIIIAIFIACLLFGYVIYQLELMRDDLEKMRKDLYKIRRYYDA